PLPRPRLYLQLPLSQPNRPIKTSPPLTTYNSFTRFSSDLIIRLSAPIRWQLSFIIRRSSSVSSFLSSAYCGIAVCGVQNFPPTGGEEFMRSKTATLQRAPQRIKNLQCICLPLTVSPLHSLDKLQTRRDTHSAHAPCHPSPHSRPLGRPSRPLWRTRSRQPLLVHVLAHRQRVSQTSPREK